MFGKMTCHDNQINPQLIQIRYLIEDFYREVSNLKGL